MSIVKFKSSPFGGLMSSNLFDLDNFFEDQLWENNGLNNRFWNRKNVLPAMNIKETENAYEIELAAPGFTKKDFNITMENGCLNIAAEKSASQEKKEETFTRKEFSYNAFQRSFQLPESVKDEDVKATYNDGILRFNLAKKEEAKKQKPKVIEVS